VKVGILRADLQIPTSRSLKEKRKVIRSLKDRLAARFNISVAEIGDQDIHQRSQIGVSFVAIDGKSALSTMQKLKKFIHSHPGAIVLGIEDEVLHEDG